MIICDTREKKNTHILAYFDRHNIAYKTQKLDVGDYTTQGKNVAVERKQNLSELSRNLMNRKDHSRFYKEIRRAKEAGVKLIVLVEHGSKIKSIQDVFMWQDKYSGVSGRQLMDAIYKAHISYGVEFLFCSKKSTGKRIVEILENA